MVPLVGMAIYSRGEGDFFVSLSRVLFFSLAFNSSSCTKTTKLRVTFSRVTFLPVEE